MKKATVKRYVDKLVKEAMQYEAPRIIDRSVDVDSIPNEEEQDPNEFLRTLEYEQLFDGTAYRSLVARFDLSRDEASDLIRAVAQREAPTSHTSTSTLRMFPKDPQYAHLEQEDEGY